MRLEDIKAYCLNKWKAYETYPFGDIPICYKLNGKVFAQIYPKQEDFKITLKCTAEAGQFYRQVYPGIVVRGYHCPPVQQPYWNTIYLEDFPDEELLNMIDHAYDAVLHSFSKKVQKQILTVDKMEIRPIRQEEYPLLEVFFVAKHPKESSGGGFLWYDAIFLSEGAAAPPREIVNQPEFAISVKKEFRRQGIGSKLMQEMIALLKNKGYEKVSLSVNKDNYAYRMYQKLGFQVIREQDEDYLMVLELQE